MVNPFFIPLSWDSAGVGISPGNLVPSFPQWGSGLFQVWLPFIGWRCLSGGVESQPQPSSLKEHGKSNVTKGCLSLRVLSGRQGQDTIKRRIQELWCKSSTLLGQRTGHQPPLPLRYKRAQAWSLGRPCSLICLKVSRAHSPHHR